MADTQIMASTRLEPVPSTPATYAGVTVSLAAPMARYSMRARDPKMLEMLLGEKLPLKIGAVLGDIACLGPDEWLWRSPDATPKNWGEDNNASIVDVSERSVCFLIEGPNARAVLNSGCPLDLENFAVGRATRTIYDGVEIIILRESEDRFAVEVWRSFSEWLWLSLNAAAAYP
jgi:sarcosine oxidase, subunit gamma